MNKAKVNQAKQAYDNMSNEDKLKVQRKLNAMRWRAQHGNNHLLRNPYENY